MKIPSEKECFRMMAEMVMFANIVAHSIRVRQVATLLVDNLNAAGFDLNLDLIRAAALLHDITKTRSFKTAENHALTGQRHLAELGFHEVGVLVGLHVSIPDFSAGGKPTVAEVLNYADKRVLHDQVVSLDTRMAYIVERYGTTEGRKQQLEMLWEQARQLENKIFAGIQFSAGDLPGKLREEDFACSVRAYQRAAETYPPCDAARNERPGTIIPEREDPTPELPGPEKHGKKGVVDFI